MYISPMQYCSRPTIRVTCTCQDVVQCCFTALGTHCVFLYLPNLKRDLSKTKKEKQNKLLSLVSFKTAPQSTLFQPEFSLWSAKLIKGVGSERTGQQYWKSPEWFLFWSVGKQPKTYWCKHELAGCSCFWGHVQIFRI